MIETYDILLNFKIKPYEFYEWDCNDDVKNIKSIPTYKVSSEVFNDFIYNEIVIDSEFLEEIKNNTKVFSGNSYKIIEYACVVYTDEAAMGLLFNKEGKIMGKSKLLYDEEEEVLNNSSKMKVKKIKYKFNKKNNINNYCTRKESKIIIIVSKYLDIIYSKNKDEEIRYMYFECFDDNEEDVNKAYIKLTESVTSADFKVINKLKTLIKVLKK